MPNPFNQSEHQENIMPLPPPKKKLPPPRAKAATGQYEVLQPNPQWDSIEEMNKWIKDNLSKKGSVRVEVLKTWRVSKIACQVAIYK